MSQPDAFNRILENDAPALFQSLSPLGRRAFYPKDIPEQAREAKGSELNGTIGVFTDGHGRAVPLDSMAAAVDLDDDDLSRAFLYSPLTGFPELRDRWRTWQRDGVDAALPSCRPFVTAGLTHGLSLAADLFGGEGRTIAVAEPFWGNYRQTFALRTGAVIRTAPGYRDGRYNPHALAEALDGLPPGEPAMGIVNFPSNPGGYAPTVAERDTLKKSLLEIADARPFVVLSDDAYAGLSYADDAPNTSFFWDLVGAHEQLVPIKLDGATKEFFFFGGRVGFLTFATPPDSEAAAVLENKISSLLRATIGSPPATSQTILLQALRRDDVRQEIEAHRRLGRERYDVLRPLLDKVDRDLLRPLPFNAGYFALLELAPGVEVEAEAVRRHLLEHHSTGVVSLGGRFLRLAICSVAKENLPEILRRLEQGVRELAGR